jgi:hypothetical protein
MSSPVTRQSRKSRLLKSRQLVLIRSHKIIAEQRGKHHIKHKASYHPVKACLVGDGVPSPFWVQGSGLFH